MMSKRKVRVSSNRKVEWAATQLMLNLWVLASLQKTKESRAIWRIVRKQRRCPALMRTCTLHIRIWVAATVSCLISHRKNQNGNPFRMRENRFWKPWRSLKKMPIKISRKSKRLLSKKSSCRTSKRGWRLQRKILRRSRKITRTR